MQFQLQGVGVAHCEDAERTRPGGGGILFKYVVNLDRKMTPYLQKYLYFKISSKTGRWSAGKITQSLSKIKSCLSKFYDRIKTETSHPLYHTLHQPTETSETPHPHTTRAFQTPYQQHQIAQVTLHTYTTSQQHFPSTYSVLTASWAVVPNLWVATPKGVATPMPWGR